MSTLAYRISRTTSIPYYRSTLQLPYLVHSEALLIAARDAVHVRRRRRDQRHVLSGKGEVTVVIDYGMIDIH